MIGSIWTKFEKNLSSGFFFQRNDLKILLFLVTLFAVANHFYFTKTKHQNCSFPIARQIVAIF